MSTVGDNATFVILVEAAREDRALASELVAILKLPPFHRKSLLNSLVQEMTLRSEQPGLIAAVSSLLDDEVAAKVIGVLAPD